MKHLYSLNLKVFFAIALSLVCFSVNAADVDADAAKAFAKQNSCFTCHGENKDKAATGFNSIAKKIKSDKDAVAKLTTHLTTAPEVTFLDKHKENHKKIDIKTDADKTALSNLINWILSL